jgi:hypothetical protein
MTRTTNQTHYKWNITGNLCGVPVDSKYLLLNTFLEEFGGDKTTLKLNRQKVNRLRSGWPCAGWDLAVTPIRQKRIAQVVYFD